VDKCKETAKYNKSRNKGFAKWKWRKSSRKGKLKKSRKENE
jgi:hypothetical protein